MGVYGLPLAIDLPKTIAGGGISHRDIFGSFQPVRDHAAVFAILQPCLKIAAACMCDQHLQRYGCDRCLLFCFADLIENVR